MKRFGVFISFILLVQFVHPQAKFTVSGYVKDAETGETMIGASVFVKSLEIGMMTNEYGLYSLTLPANDTFLLNASYINCEVYSKKVFLTENLKLDIELTGKSMDDVVIEARGLKEKLNSSQMGLEEVSMVEARKIPAIFGEVDIIKILQLKPGVQSGGEGLSGIYVRGGGPDQNLILLDEAQVYNASHLFGFFSTFNPDAVKDVKLYKGGFPAEFGGKLSSVIDVRLNEGNDKKFSGSGGLGLISSRLTLEVPIVKDKASFMVAGRRTYFDVFTRFWNEYKKDDPTYNKIPDYYFYDLNIKGHYDIGEKDKIFLSGYFGRDVFGFKADDFEANFTWGNQTGTLRWNHIFSPKLFLKTAFTYSDYNYLIDNSFASFKFQIGSGITDYAAKADLAWLPNNKHEVKFGTNFVYHKFDIGRLEASNTDSSFSLALGTNYYGQQFGVYVQDDWKVNPRLTLNAGLRFSGFHNDGKVYTGLEPRAAVKFSITEKMVLKGSYTRMYQYIHMISNSGASLPTDIWYPSRPTIKPQLADQVAGGISIQLGKHFLLTNEYYYKWLKNQVDFRDNAQIFANDSLDNEFVFGKGWGYGTEILIEKKSGKLTGWIGYTLSWSWRQFDDIMGGKPFHPRYDRRHDASVVLIYDLSKRWSFTGAWIYGTGNAFSLPVGRYFTQEPIPGETPDIVPVFTGRNEFRLPAYNRLDLGVVFNFFPKWGESDLTLSVFNAYSRRNAFFIYLDIIEDENDNPVRVAAKQVSLFPIIPTLTWNFKF